MAVSWFLLLLLLLSSGFTFSEAVNTPVPHLSEDAMSLLSFKSYISHDPSNLLSNWNSSTNHCVWYGVQCDDPISGRVISLNLNSSSSSLSGTLHPSIGDIASLQNLELQGNNFTGPIPYQIRNLPSLRHLNLSYNSLSGPIPDSLIGYGSSLSVIDLSHNQLSGGIIIHDDDDDAESDKCHVLTHLKLSSNFLVGNIPPEIGKCSNLTTLLIDANILEGQIPPEIGQLTQLRILDVSRNSLTLRIPKELSNCHSLSVVVFTNLVDSFSGSDSISTRGEFNAFVGGIPHGVFSLPMLQILWAPRANLGGRLPRNWSHSCSLRVINLGQNYFTGWLPESIVMCRNLTFLDLSSNGLRGYLPSRLQIPCMVYFNVSQNMLSGGIPSFGNGGSICDIAKSSYGLGRPDLLDVEDIQNAYWVNTLFGSTTLDENSVVVAHDFSWNSFAGSLPLISFGDGFLPTGGKTSYKLLLNNNRFNGSVPGVLLANCDGLHSFSVNMSANQISGALSPELLRDCSSLTNFEAAGNRIVGSIPPAIGSLKMLQFLDLSRNGLYGSMPDQFGELKNLKQISLSQNNLSGTIPATLASAANLEILLLDHNMLSGEIPSSFSTLSSLVKLDLSFNNLSGHIPRLQYQSDCESFQGNKFLQPCPDSNSASPAGLPVPLEVQKRHNKHKLRSFIIAMATSASVVVCILGVIVLALALGRRKLGRLTSLRRRKVMVTFADAPADLNYDNVVRATGNFSISHLIGTGGFGSTYKAELVPGFLVAVKRLSIGRFQGIQQFDAEIRTLGRIRHKNLVTLVGYYVGEAEMFLVYNYLSGGNLETFIHETSSNNVKWPVIHKIAVDIAQALAFLHYSCVPRIVHRDIKPSNILLDEEHNAYISDFGLARLLEVFETHATTDVAGTFGYVAPEYATTCRVSDKADVYSFGVVLLELMSGKKSLDPSFSEYGNGFNIVAWAKLLIQEGRSSELFSPELWEAGPQDNMLGMLRLASTCTVETLSVRPSMKQVLERLKQLRS